VRQAQPVMDAVEEQTASISVFSLNALLEILLLGYAFLGSHAVEITWYTQSLHSLVWDHLVPTSLLWSHLTGGHCYWIRVLV
jgi:hypothetical protein